VFVGFFFFFSWVGGGGGLAELDARAVTDHVAVAAETIEHFQLVQTEGGRARSTETDHLQDSSFGRFLPG